VDRTTRSDTGYTLIELLLVVLIMSIMTTVVVMAVVGARTDAETNACAADRRNLGVAAERYFAEHTTSTLPATGTGPGAYEVTLISAGYLTDPSTYHDLDPQGRVAPASLANCPS
jgi:prepilin-type N-terminal cleavage/methylation domain-containing protein